MFNIYLVSAHGDPRFPEILAGPDTRIILICCSASKVRASQFVDEVIEISNHRSCSNFVKELIANRSLIESLNGWIIFGRDDDMYQLGRSNLALELKLKLLPVKNPDTIHIPGSKCELVSLAKTARYKIPISENLNSSLELSSKLETFPTPFIIKSERGSGGMSVRRVNDSIELVILPIPESWYPIVIQEFIAEDLRGVDALFREGHLVAWMYCDNFKSPTEFGPSTNRRYVEPPTLDFEEDLIKFGMATGAHGFANCSFFYIPSTNSHLLIEVDLRTNAWHQFGKIFGIEWRALMQDPLDEVLMKIKSPQILSPNGYSIVLWQRYIEYAIQNRKWRIIFRLLRMKKSERSPIDFQDVAINRGLLIGLFRLVPLAFAKFLYEFLPVDMKKRLKSQGTTARVADIIAAN